MSGFTVADRYSTGMVAILKNRTGDGLGDMVSTACAMLRLKRLGYLFVLSFGSLGLGWKVNMCGRWHHFQKLTVGVRFARGNHTIHFALNQYP